MQIFVLDYNPIKAAQYHANKHVGKQLIEACQILCTTMRVHGIDYGYKITHKNNKCRLWAEESKSNFNWLKALGLELANEHKFRHGTCHKTEQVLMKTFCPEDIPDIGLTDFVLNMPNEIKCQDAVQSYRRFYRLRKAHLLIYKKRKPPFWLLDIAKYID